MMSLAHADYLNVRISETASSTLSSHYSWYVALPSVTFVHLRNVAQGTGNQTPHVSSAILERLFLDPSMRLFEFSESSLLANVPKMYAFPCLGDVYQAWHQHLEERGVRVLLSTEVTSVVERRNGKPCRRPPSGSQSTSPAQDHTSR